MNHTPSIVRRVAAWLVAGILSLPAAVGVAAQDELSSGFAQPGPDTRPACYWYWISDNISKEGITRDLEAMARVGIGEAFIGNVVDPDTPLGDVKLMSDAWFECMTHAAVEAKRLGVKISVFNGPGWSQSGGPWVSPGQSMRYVVASETAVRGPAKFEGRLPVPKEPFQDIEVLAYPAPREDSGMARIAASQVRCSPETPSGSALVDGNTSTVCAFPKGASASGETFTVDITFDQPFTARSLALHPGNGSFAANCELFAEDGAGGYRLVREFVLDRRGLSRPDYLVIVGFMPRGPAVVSFDAVTARAFRLKTTLVAIEGTPARRTGANAPGLGEIVLSAAARVDRVVEKQLGKMFPSTQPGWDAYRWPASVEPESDFTVPVERIVRLSHRMEADGTLHWDVPSGDWIIQRIGMTPTGAKNHPTTAQGQGLEVDKMNRTALEAHFNGFIGPYLSRVPAAAREALSRVVIDSYEVGAQNWTDGFQDTFRADFGYDPRPWLPVLSGRVVGSADQSDRFLWDLRRHIADRIGTEYVGALRSLSNRNGLRLWLENYGHWGFPAEFLHYGGQSDDVGGEFWVREVNLTGRERNDLRSASSAAHVYGRQKVYAEAFTSGRSFQDAPVSLKAHGDWAFTQGINHLVLHVYIHQPWEERKPGVNAWFGTEFNRHNTWFEQSKAWMDYLRRCHFMLQRGNNVADVAYYIGESTPVMIGIREPALPAGYAYDYINADVLLNRARVVDGRLEVSGGSSYAVLVLPPDDAMRPEVLRRLKELVSDGLTLVGRAPLRSPSMEGYPACDREVASLAGELWGPSHVAPVPRRAFGKGFVVRTDDLAPVLQGTGSTPDVVAPNGLLWTHRQDGGTDIYFVANSSEKAVVADISFRVEGRVPEFWHADSGVNEASAWFESAGGRTRVPVPLDPSGSMFVVFRKPAPGSSVIGVTRNGAPMGAGLPISPVKIGAGERGALTLEANQPGRYIIRTTAGRESEVSIAIPEPIEVKGWQVRFPRAAGSDKQFAFEKLLSWSEHDDEEVKHFSGSAIYSARVEVPAEALKPGRRLNLDLGSVDVIAELRINGHDAGVLWKYPFAADITKFAQPGSNDIEVRVTNLWWNRLVGDEGVPVEKRGSYTTAPARATRKGLVNSGLLGPVTLSVTETVQVGK